MDINVSTRSHTYGIREYAFDMATYRTIYLLFNSQLITDNIDKFGTAGEMTLSEVVLRLTRG